MGFGRDKDGPNAVSGCGFAWRAARLSKSTRPSVLYPAICGDEAKREGGCCAGGPRLRGVGLLGVYE